MSSFSKMHQLCYNGEVLCMSDRLGCSVSIPCCFGSRPLSCGPFPVLGVAGIRWNGPVTLTPATSPGNEDGGKGANKKEDGSAAVSISSPHSPSTFFSPLLPSPKKMGKGGIGENACHQGTFFDEIYAQYINVSPISSLNVAVTRNESKQHDFSMPMGQIRG